MTERDRSSRMQDHANPQEKSSGHPGEKGLPSQGANPRPIESGGHEKAGLKNEGDNPRPGQK